MKLSYTLYKVLIHKTGLHCSTTAWLVSRSKEQRLDSHVINEKSQQAAGKKIIDLKQVELLARFGNVLNMATKCQNWQHWLESNQIKIIKSKVIRPKIRKKNDKKKNSPAASYLSRLLYIKHGLPPRSQYMQGTLCIAQHAMLFIWNINGVPIVKDLKYVTQFRSD